MTIPPLDDLFLSSEQIRLEFANLMPSPSPGELARMTGDLISQQTAQKFFIWKQQMILIDDYSRFVTCLKNQIPFRCVLLDLPDRESASKWMIKHQMDQRQYSRLTMSYWRGWRLHHESLKRGGYKTGNKAKGEKRPLTTAAERIGLEYGYSATKIKDDRRLYLAIVKIVGNCGEEAKNLLLATDMRQTCDSIIELSKLTTVEKQMQRIEEIRLNGPAPKKRTGIKPASITLPNSPEGLGKKLPQRWSQEDVLKTIECLYTELKTRGCS